ncbi:MAG TPA: response regulator [Chloroflexota bacterium]|nr:response regulator [Chloroflexota bacterium]
MAAIFSRFHRAQPEAPVEPARILVVDDESNIRMMIRMALQHVGHTVDVASDGPEGLVKFGDGSDWDLVLLDHRMPGMSGLDVLKEIHQRSPAARVVMITAFGTIDLAVDAMKSGATDFLRKPFTAEVLRGAVQAALHSPRIATPTVGEAVTGSVAAAPITFGLTGINGFHIESNPGSGIVSDGAVVNTFGVRSPEGEVRKYGVMLPCYVVELVKAYADKDEMPGGMRFWQALCEEVLANYLWQHGEFPLDATVQVDDLTTGLRRWIDSVLAAANAEIG